MLTINNSDEYCVWFNSNQVDELYYISTVTDSRNIEMNVFINSFTKRDIKLREQMLGWIVLERRLKRLQYVHN